MILSKRILSIKESPTLAVTAKAGQLKKNGQDVIILAAGEPDFDTPGYIKDAAIKAIEGGKTKYTNVGGTPELKEAIINKFSRENNLKYTANEVTVSCGAKHSIYNVLQVIINDGDEVIIPAPYWVSYPDMVLLANGIPVMIECNQSENYKLTPEKLKSAITNKTRAIILNSPNNPTGMVYHDSELLALANILKEHKDIYIISDDIYEHILFSDKSYKNIVNLAPELKDRTFVINGVSKGYSMTGWRIGFTACNNPQLIKAMENFQSQCTSNPCSISQAAATAALNSGITDFILEMQKAFVERHNYVVNRINSINGLHCYFAEGAFYAFIECSNAIESVYNQGKISEKTDLALANYLLDEVLVAVVPGSAFGLNNHFRISFATSIEELKKALDRIEKILGTN